jgi:hypothetical protein
MLFKKSSHFMPFTGEIKIMFYYSANCGCTFSKNFAFQQGKIVQRQQKKPVWYNK